MDKNNNKNKRFRSFSKTALSTSGVLEITAVVKVVGRKFTHRGLYVATAKEFDMRLLLTRAINRCFDSLKFQALADYMGFQGFTSEDEKQLFYERVYKEELDKFIFNISVVNYRFYYYSNVKRENVNGKYQTIARDTRTGEILDSQRWSYRVKLEDLEDDLLDEDIEQEQ